MVSSNDPSVNPIRISVRLDPALHRRLRDIAANHEQSLSQFVLDTLEQRLRTEADRDGLTALTATADPLLADRWDNPRDSPTGATPACCLRPPSPGFSAPFAAR